MARTEVRGRGHTRPSGSSATAFDDRRAPAAIHLSSNSSWWRLWWSPTHQRLAQHPVFAECSRAQIRRVARWGDEIEVPAGETLARQDKIGYWFLAIHSGQVRLTRHGEPAAPLGPGDHFGDIAILGLGPQPATAETMTPCRLFVLGRQYLIGAIDMAPAIQQGLYPAVATSDWPAHLREMRAAGRAAWHRLGPVRRRRARRAVPSHGGSFPFADNRSAAIHPLPRLGDDARRRAPPARQVALVPFRVIAGLVAAPALAVFCAALFLWHPPVAVITPSEPIDISEDLWVSGAPTYPINGAYLVTPVDVRRPTLAGLLGAWVQRDATRPVHSERIDVEAFREAARRAFADGHRHARTAVEAAVGLDVPDLEVEFAPRDLFGPSAGLVYALALADLLSPEDLARGRTIAATGELLDDGRVIPVSHVPEKAKGADGWDAVLFLTPPGQDPDGAGTVGREVRSLEDALALLAQR